MRAVAVGNEFAQEDIKHGVDMIVGKAEAILAVIIDALLEAKDGDNRINYKDLMPLLVANEVAVARSVDNMIYNTMKTYTVRDRMNVNIAID